MRFLTAVCYLPHVTCLQKEVNYARDEKEALRDQKGLQITFFWRRKVIIRIIMIPTDQLITAVSSKILCLKLNFLRTKIDIHVLKKNNVFVFIKNRSMVFIFIKSPSYSSFTCSYFL